MRPEEGPELELELRRAAYDSIRQTPGIHYRELQRVLDMAPGSLEYHLRYLEESGLVLSKEDRYYRRYYPADIGSVQKDILAGLRQKNPRRVVLHLLALPDSTHGEIMEALGFSPSTLSFYLRDLEKKGIIAKAREGRSNLYRVTDEHEVVKVLLTYRASFLDQVVDRFLDVWFEPTNRGKKPRFEVMETMEVQSEPEGKEEAGNVSSENSTGDVTRS